MDSQNPPASSHRRQQQQQPPQQSQSQSQSQQGGQQQQQQQQASSRQKPGYDIRHVGHYAQLSTQGYGNSPDLYTGVWANVCFLGPHDERSNNDDARAQPRVNQGLQGHYRDILTTYWKQTIESLENETHDYKQHQLPLARIKKVMKADPEVKMISAEAPILFAKGCDIFITELTMRAWIHAEENKRRTLQRSDIASALAKSDMFDFLIDIVPREEAVASKRSTGQASGLRDAQQAAASSSSTQQQTPGQSQQQQQPAQQQQGPGQQQQQHGPRAMAPPDYASLGSTHDINTEYRAQPGMYSGPGSESAYGPHQPQMYGDMGGMYGYPAMPSQQMYQMGQRNQDPSATTQEQGPHGYQRHEGGGGAEADAEGERDFGVG
ncbi:MAG: hypothetical protein M1816_005181 [Peltula sp. TS41687]|nr:MAG: hypothetical protein M1816_005181 [Peltula sp. TS41687]